MSFGGSRGAVSLILAAGEPVRPEKLSGLGRASQLVPPDRASSWRAASGGDGSARTARAASYIKILQLRRITTGGRAGRRRSWYWPPRLAQAAPLERQVAFKPSGACRHT